MAVEVNRQDHYIIRSIVSGMPFQKFSNPVSDASKLAIFSTYEYDKFVQAPGKPGTEHELSEYECPKQPRRLEAIQKINELCEENIPNEDKYLNSIMELISSDLYERIENAAFLNTNWNLSDLMYHVLFADKNLADTEEVAQIGVVFKGLEWIWRTLSNKHYAQLDPMEYLNEDTLMSDLQADVKEDSTSLLKRVFRDCFEQGALQASLFNTAREINASRLAEKAKTDGKRATIDRFLNNIKYTDTKKYTPILRKIGAALMFFATLPLQILSLHYILPSIATLYILLNAPALAIAFMIFCHLLFLYYFFKIHFFAPKSDPNTPLVSDYVQRMS